MDLTRLGHAATLPPPHPMLCPQQEAAEKAQAEADKKASAAANKAE